MIMGMWTLVSRHAAAGVFLLAGVVFSPLHAQRITVPLDGTWSIGESVVADAIPASFAHTVPVPGLVHAAVPKFPDVDQYHTHEWSYTFVTDMHRSEERRVGKECRSRWS